MYTQRIFKRNILLKMFSLVAANSTLNCKFFQGVFVAILYAFYLWGHIPVSNICYALSDQYTPEVYRHYVVFIGKGLLLIYLAGLAWLLRKTRHTLLKTIAWILFLLDCILVMKPWLKYQLNIFILYNIAY